MSYQQQYIPVYTFSIPCNPLSKIHVKINTQHGYVLNTQHNYTVKISQLTR